MVRRQYSECCVRDVRTRNIHENNVAIPVDNWYNIIIYRKLYTMPALVRSRSTKGEYIMARDERFKTVSFGGYDKTTVDEYIDEQHTFFILETLETLRKAGRLSGVKAMLASALSIKPVMGSTPEGSIQQLGQGRGMIRAIDKMVDDMLQVTLHTDKKTLAISHCNAPATAERVKEAVLKKANFKEVKIINTRGVSSMYANDGGIIMVV